MATERQEKPSEKRIVKSTYKTNCPNRLLPYTRKCPGIESAVVIVYEDSTVELKCPACGLIKQMNEKPSEKRVIKSTSSTICPNRLSRDAECPSPSSAVIIAYTDGTVELKCPACGLTKKV